jgi:aminopeptidase
MKDPRFDKLAKVLIGHSTGLKKGEKVLVEAIDTPPEMVISLLREIDRVGGIPFVTVKQNLILRELYKNATETSMTLTGQFEAARMDAVDAYIALRGSYNIAEASDVPNEKMKLYQEHWWKPVHIEIRVPKTKWVVLRWPYPSMAQQANMSTEAFEDFYFDVCTLDYQKMDQAMIPLENRMQTTDQVHIVGPGTDLKFSIKNLPHPNLDVHIFLVHLVLPLLLPEVFLDL